MKELMEAFVQRIIREGLRVEGIAINRDGKLILEHRFLPDRPRNIYSNTKSFTATAVGMAISDGKVSLDDSLAECFPYAVPAEASTLLFKIKLRHLLTMSSGFDTPLLMNNMRRSGIGMPDYVKYMLSQPVRCEPGDHFRYSTADSILLGRIVEEKVGILLSQYLYERLFQPLDIGFPQWEHCPMGHPIGGGGLYLRLSDMMKLGQLYLDKGKWQGKQLLDPAWISTATRKQIDTPKNCDQEIWNCGYVYQFWLLPYPGAYRADGAFGQITTVLPEYGIVVGIQCPEDNTGNFDKVRVALHEELYSKIA